MVVAADLLKRLKETNASAVGRPLPGECYTDEAFFALELERVLRPEWHAVARATDLPDVGDYRAIDLFDEPIVLVRDEEKRLRAYSGICPHRAFPFAQA